MAGYIGSKTVNLSTTGADIAGDADVSGDLTVDTNTLHVDSTNNRVGIGTSSPSAPLDIKLNTTSTADIFKFQRSDGAVAGVLNYNGTDGAISLGTTTAHPLAFDTNNVERMRIDSSGNVGIGQSPQSFAKLQVKTDTNKQIAMFSNTDGATIGGITDIGGSTTLRLAGAPLIMTGGGGSGSEAMRIDSSGNVGIGTSSPLAAGSSYTVLDIGSSSTASLLNMTDNGTETGRIVAQSNQLHLSSGTASGFISFRTGGFSSGDEAMRIDSSGNLLVGKTSSSFGTAGIEARSGGTLWATASGTNAASFNRLSSDGAIAYFNKDGSTVGSIGSVASGANLYMSAASGVGLGIGGDNLYPVNASGNSTNGALDIGDATARFKDLYLSGGIEIENGTGNVGVGKEALRINTGGTYNTALGYRAGYDLTSGVNNTLIGGLAGHNLTSGSNNTFIGAARGECSGGKITTGSQNTILGPYDGNQGGLDIRTSSNNIVLSDGDGNPRLHINSSGHMSSTSMNSSATANSDLRYNPANGAIYYQTSSLRYKSNVTDIELDTSNIYNLRPVSFDDDATGERTYGLIAEETYEQIPELVNLANIEGEQVPDNIPYSMLSVLLLAEMKKLKVELDAAKERITALENA